jgi:4-amino-4-deoxy-L-arabinose transferase-like glycosyltransferase
MTDTTSRDSDRREWLVVLALTLVASALRFWSFGRMGLTHFDEGVYALEGLWSVTPRGLGGLDPDLVPYAPPVYPIMVGVLYSVLGISDAAPLLVSAGCGVATVPVAAWVARRTFGPGSGAAAAAFASLSVAHVAFSRKGLTDSTFLLVWLLSLGLGGRFLERPGFVRALAFGLAVGLAQNVKYNGWIAGAVVLLAALIGIGADPGSRRATALLRTFGWGLLAALVAALTYLPWFRFVEGHGGYSSLLIHQRGYLGGVAEWPRHWNQQLAQVVALSGGVAWSAATWAVAWFCAALAANGLGLVEGCSHWDWPRFRLGLLFGSAVLAGLPDLGWWVGLAWFAWLLADKKPAVRVLGAYWLVLSVLTPFYHPYARLWLPLHAAGWLLLAGAVVTVGPFAESGRAFPIPERSVLTRPGLLARGVFLIACLLWARAHWAGGRPVPFPFSRTFMATTGLRDSVSEALTRSPLPVDGTARLRVLARRPVAFYATLRGAVPFRLVADRSMIESGPDSLSDWALVDDALAPRLGEVRLETNRSGLAYERAASWPLWLDPVTRLDVSPESAWGFDPLEPRSLILLRPRSRPIPGAKAVSGAGAPFHDPRPGQQPTDSRR